jgi:hypothetical protein
VDRHHRPSTLTSASALFLALAALFLMGAPAERASRAAGGDDCVLGRDAGTAAPRCYALNPASPYVTGGLGGTPIGADAAALDRIAACVAAGDTRSPECAIDASTTSVMASPQAPHSFRIVR